MMVHVQAMPMVLVRYEPRGCNGRHAQDAGAKLYVARRELADVGAPTARLGAPRGRRRGGGGVRHMHCPGFHCAADSSRLNNHPQAQSPKPSHCCPFLKRLGPDWGSHAPPTPSPAPRSAPSDGLTCACPPQTPPRPPHSHPHTRRCPWQSSCGAGQVAAAAAANVTFSSLV